MPGDGPIGELIRTSTLASWLPPWLSSIILLVGAVAVALTINRYVHRLLDRLLRGEKMPLLRSLKGRLAGPGRAALVLAAMSLVLPALALPQPLAGGLGKIVTVLLVALGGWSAVIAVNIASELHLRRYRIDVDDNLLARKHVTQVRLLVRALDTIIVLMTFSAALMTFDAVREYGVTLFASAGVAGIFAGLAARPLLANFFAGIQIALTQPIRVDDAVVVEGEWGWIEDITSTYVVVKIWDLRRLILPLTYFIEKPFQNWTREGNTIIGSIFLHVDYMAPIEEIRQKFHELAKASSLWDGKVAVLQVTEAKEHTVELRALASASTSPRAWDLRCELREGLITYLRDHHPAVLPRLRMAGAESGATPSEGQTPAYREPVNPAPWGIHR